MDNSANSEPAWRQYDLVRDSANYPARHEPPVRSLVVCTQQRCGSTLLGEAIYFAGGLGCPLEYFHAGFRPQFEARWKTTGLQEYLTTLHRLRTDPSGVFSVKLFWRDIVDLARERAPAEFGFMRATSGESLSREAHGRILEMLSECMPNPLFVLLTRRDQVRQAVSLTVAGQTRRWRRFVPSGEGRRHDLDYVFDDTARLLALIQRHNLHWHEFFRANEMQYISLAYEDLEQDYRGTLQQFFAAIGRPDAPIPPPRLLKQADARSEEMIERFLAEFRLRARGCVP